MTHYGHLARVLHWLTDQTLTAQLDEMELTASQGRILGYLGHQSQPPCPRDIEEEFRLTHPTVSGLLTRLEKKGFVTLAPDPEDRRCKRVMITQKGIGVNQRIHESILQMERQMVQDFTPEERAAFAQYLTRAITNMGHSPQGPGFKEETTK